jgi:tetratricopeptide (TPR) repeat protein
MSDQNSNWRARPIFISSTFKDMQAERDYLRSHIFPRLEERLRERHHYFEPIDLRLGVESAESGTEEARELLVLKVCLDEIQRSRPFLIVILGDRYGWVPPPERMQTATREVGFTTEVRGKSVTALEIEFGVLREHPDQRQRCFLYFRDPLPYDRMPLEVAQQYSDALSSDPGVRGGHQQLQALKEHILADPELGPRVHAYDAMWDPSTGRVTGLQEWGEMVFQHLWAVLDEETRDFVSQPPQTLEQRERAAHIEFTVQCSRDFTGREALLAQLLGIVRSAAVDGATWGVCVTGSAGSGKSAVLAELYQRLATDDGPLILANAAGATPRGAEPDAMLRRFIGELATALGIDDPLPKNAGPDDVDATFASLLTRAAQQRRVIVLLDALDQFDPTPRGQHLSWLRARQWPANARIIATGITGTAPVDALTKNNGVETINLPALETPEIAEIARLVWRRYHRQVNPEVLRALEGKKLPDGSSAAGNPLWLTLALEQLNLLDADDFARADREFTGGPAERLHALLVDTATRMPSDVPELYGWLLEQTEKTFGMPHARAFAVLIALSRIGWRESDMMKLVPVIAKLLFPQAAIPALDELKLAAIRRGFRAHLTRRGGQICFFHNQILEAVRTPLQWPLQSYPVCQSMAAAKIHRAIADHLESLPVDDPLRESELMEHLIAGDDKERAARLYGDRQASPNVVTSATTSITLYLAASLESASGKMRMPVAWLRKQLGLEERQHPLAWAQDLTIQPLMSDDEKATLVRRFIFDLNGALKTVNNINLRNGINQSAHDALVHLIARASGNISWQHLLAVSLINLGEVSKELGDRLASQRNFQEAHAIAKGLVKHDPANPEYQSVAFIALNTLGDLAHDQGDFDEAVRCYYLSKAVVERLAANKQTDVIWQEHHAASLNNWGDIEMECGNRAEASRCYSASREISERLVARYPAQERHQLSLSTSLFKLGDLSLGLGDYSTAQRFHAENKTIVENLASVAPTDPVRQQALAMALERLSDLARVEGDVPLALQHCIASSNIIESLAFDDPDNGKLQHDAVFSRIRLSELQLASGRCDVALQVIHMAHDTAKSLCLRFPQNTDFDNASTVAFSALNRVLLSRYVIARFLLATLAVGLALGGIVLVRINAWFWLLALPLFYAVYALLWWFIDSFLASSGRLIRFKARWNIERKGLLFKNKARLTRK